MQKIAIPFVTRWLVNSVGIWLAVALLGTGYSDKPEGVLIFLLAGFIFSLVNSFLRPLVIFLSLPALVLTLGLFMIVVNGILVYIALILAPGIEMKFWNAVFAGLVLSLLNYIISNFVQARYLEKRSKYGH